uniref:Transposable element Tc3 transposase n=1 Tax=Rhabditophanes sp. KR3021 TaxID=114890 RepID=A0AC35U8F2_9BILA
MFFAETDLQRLEDDDFRLGRLFFSDEAHFHMDSTVNRHNYRYRATENPHWYQEVPLHSEKTTVWAGIYEGGLIGPFFFDTTANKDRYLEMLKDKFYPEVLRRRLENEMIFMQDRAPPHWTLSVQTWLNDKFPNRWIGRDSPSVL